MLILGDETEDIFGRFEMAKEVGVTFVKVEVDDMGDAGEVDFTGGGFGGDEDSEFASEELTDRAVAEFRLLRSMDGVGRQPGGIECRGEEVDVFPGSKKDGH